ncbi:hypothetical protein ACW180_00110 [Limosilactobacillus fermentum]
MARKFLTGLALESVAVWLRKARTKESAKHLREQFQGRFKDLMDYLDGVLLVNAGRRRRGVGDYEELYPEAHNLKDT